VQGVKDLAMDCLKKPEAGDQDGERKEKTTLRERIGRGAKDRAVDRLKSEAGRKKVTLRVIELDSVLALPSPRLGTPSRFNLGSVKAEEYGV